MVFRSIEELHFDEVVGCFVVEFGVQRLIVDADFMPTGLVAQRVTKVGVVTFLKFCFFARAVFAAERFVFGCKVLGDVVLDGNLAKHRHRPAAGCDVVELKRRE
jgi:hypothetical protein